MTEYRGERTGEGRRFAIVASRFNPTITEALLRGAIDCLRAGDVRDVDIDVAHVPGALEIPVVAKRLAESGVYAGIVCVGAVIRGDTSHHELVAARSASGAMDVSLATGVPVTMGIVTADDLAQAEARAGGEMGNRGWDAAAAALEVASLIGRLPGPIRA